MPSTAIVISSAIVLILAFFVWFSIRERRTGKKLGRTEDIAKAQKQEREGREEIRDATDDAIARANRRL